MKFVNIEITHLLSNLEIDGVKLPEYCQATCIDFNKIVEGFSRQRKNKSLNNRSDLELVLSLISNQFSRKKYALKSKLQVHGMNANDFAEIHKVPPISLRSSIYRGRKLHPGMTDDELADVFVQRYNRNHTVFLYYGVLVRDLPTLYGVEIDEEEVKRIYEEVYENKIDLPFDAAINEIVDTLIGMENKRNILRIKASQAMQDGE